MKPPSGVACAVAVDVNMTVYAVTDFIVAVAVDVVFDVGLVVCVCVCAVT